MTTPNWNDLERAWRSLPPSAAPVVRELERLRSRQWWTSTTIAMEILIAAAALVAAAWLLGRGDAISFAMGIGTIVFTSVVGALSYRARAGDPVRLDEPVAAAVALALRRARVGVRLARATCWAVCAALVFTAMMALLRAIGPPLDAGAAKATYFAFAIAQVWLATFLAGSLVHLRRRAADVERLVRVADTLHEPSGDVARADARQRIADDV